MSIVQNKSNRKSYGRVVLHMPLWRRDCNGAANNPQYSVSRFNNQLPCEPLSNAEFCKAQLICCRNERLANCDSPQILPRPEMSAFVWDIWMCVCVPEGQQNERLTNSLRVMQILWWLPGLLVYMHVCDVCVYSCGCVEDWVRGLKNTTH